MDVSFSCVCPVIDNEFRHNIVKAALQAHFFKKSPFGDLQLQNGSHKKILVAKKKLIIAVISRGGHFVYVT